MLPSDVLEIRYYLSLDGRSPFEKWFAGLDPVARAKVTTAIVRLEQNAMIEIDPMRVRRGAKLTVDLGDRQIVESVDDILGDPATPMTKDDVIKKFHRYTEPTLGRQHAESLATFILESDAAQPGRGCFTFGR